MKKFAYISIFLLMIQPLAYADNERHQEMQRWLRAHEAEQQQEQRDEARRQENEAKRAQNCGRARDRASRYERAGGLYEFDENGERKYLNKEKRAEAEAWAQSEVEKWCN